MTDVAGARRNGAVRVGGAGSADRTACGPLTCDAEGSTFHSERYGNSMKTVEPHAAWSIAGAAIRAAIALGLAAFIAMTVLGA